MDLEMSTKFQIKPIGIIHSPYKTKYDAPHQGDTTISKIEIFPEFAEGLTDIEGFSHLHIIYWLHLEWIILFHPFVDGNKRTAIIFTFEFLREYGYKIEVEPEEIVSVATNIAIKGLHFGEIKDWLSKITKVIK